MDRPENSEIRSDLVSNVIYLLSIIKIKFLVFISKHITKFNHRFMFLAAVPPCGIICHKLLRYNWNIGYILLLFPGSTTHLVSYNVIFYYEA